MNIKTMAEFTVVDEKDFVPELSHNGGHYAYYYKYARFSDGWRVECTDSSEFGQNDRTFDESQVYSDLDILKVIWEVINANDNDIYIDNIIEY